MSAQIAPKGTLVYQRRATKHMDGRDGFLWVHSWGTGYQHLVFTSNENAVKFAEMEGLEVVK